jgi:hypothetical protein
MNMNTSQLHKQIYKILPGKKNKNKKVAVKYTYFMVTIVRRDSALLTNEKRQPPRHQS